jgi:hypothetical protein
MMQNWGQTIVVTVCLIVAVPVGVWLGTWAANSPGDCHRHHTILVPLAKEGVIVQHIFENEVIDAPDLQAAIEADSDYKYEELTDVLAKARASRYEARWNAD